MLIVNADDWGRSEAATDRALDSFRRGRITSASAMVFMADSKRAASLALGAGIDTGLHLNFTEPLTAPGVPSGLQAAHEAVRRFLRGSRYALLWFHPLLVSQFKLLVTAQRAEYQRLFAREPSHYNGHQHMHLCTNVLLQHLLPPGAAVRRSFSFRAGEKAAVNRLYRAWVDRRLAVRHRLTDGFYALSQHMDSVRLSRIANLARQATVELMCHPELDAEHRLLGSEAFARVVAGVPMGTYTAVG